MVLPLLVTLVLLSPQEPAVPDAGQHRGREPDSPLERILPLRARAELEDRWLALRLERLVPRLLREAGVDTWILVAREYNEDPVVLSMLPATWFSARRTTILLLHAPSHPERRGPAERPERGPYAAGERGEPTAETEGEPAADSTVPPAASGMETPELRRLAVARYDIGDFFQSVWDPEEEPDPWARLGELVAELRPRRIAIDVSDDFALADGLTSSLHVKLLKSLPPQYQRPGFVTLKHHLPIRWLETRIPEEMEAYPEIAAIAHAILGEALSSQAISPGETTTDDLAWWLRERVEELDLDVWFHPSVSVQRAGAGHGGSFAERPAAQTIQPGDLVHVDFGIVYLGLATDMQQHAYVLREGESEAPPGLRAALAVGNRLQDVLVGEFEAGRSGNEILAAALERAAEEEIAATIYTHPLGYHGHGAGPTIGLWDQQEGVPGAGDYPLHPDTVHSIELSVEVPVPEWNGQPVRMMLEENAFFDGESVTFLDGRQGELHLVR